MDILFDNLEALIFIAIFIVSIISSIFKKRKQSDEADDGETAPPAPVPRPQRQVPRQQPVNIDEEMRKTLENIFSSKQPAESQRSTYEDRKQASQYDSRKSVDPHTRAHAQPQAAKRLVRAGVQEDDEWTAALRSREARESAKTAALAEALVYETPEQASISDSDHTLLAQARNGIIWSEILQRPVSMR